MAENGPFNKRSIKRSKNQVAPVRVSLNFSPPSQFQGRCLRKTWANVGRTPKGAYSSRGRPRHLLETAFSEPSENPSQNPFLLQNPEQAPFSETLLRIPSPEPFPEPSQNPNLRERCVAVRPLRRAPKTEPSAPKKTHARDGPPKDFSRFSRMRAPWQPSSWESFWNFNPHIRASSEPTIGERTVLGASRRPKYPVLILP